MVNKMENKGKVKEVEISKRLKFRMFLKLVRMYFYKFIKRRWYLPSVSEMTVDELHDRINSDLSPLIIDVTEPRFYEGQDNPDIRPPGHIQNAELIPIMELTSNLEDLQPYLDKEIVTICPGGGMSLIAVDIMTDAGFHNVKSLTGGMELWIEKGYPFINTVDDAVSPNESAKPSTSEDKIAIIEGKQSLDEISMTEVHKTVDARGLLCPHPILKSRKAMKSLKINQVLEILTTDPGSKTDIPAWAHATGQVLLISEDREPKEFRFLVQRVK
jgi:TusA-related sulfurtransferase/rhodanese-related sulfurtransferase